MSTASWDIDGSQAQVQRLLDTLEGQVQTAGLQRGEVLELRREIAQWYRAQQLLREERDRLELAMEAGQAGMVKWDLRANKAWWNTCAYQIHGYPPHSLEPTYDFWLSRIHPEDRKQVEAQVAACLQERRSEIVCEYRVVRPGGEVRWVRGAGRFTFDAHGIAGFFTGIAQDITERRQAEDALRRSDATLRRLKEANIIGIIQGEEQRITDANEIFLGMLGYRREELETNQLLYPQITPPEYAPLDEQAVRELRTTGAIKPFEKEYFRRDGSRVPVLIGIAKLADTPLQWICFVMDMTEQKRAQVAIQRSKEVIEQASEAKDRFMAALSHELRTPLTPVLAAVQMMDRDPALTPEQRDEVHMVQRNVALEARLIDDLLDLTRISRGKLELHRGPVDMHLLLQQVVEVCDSDLRSKQLRFTMELTAPHHHVLGDAARLQQAVWNLLKNAIKFTPSGGGITLRTDQPAEGRLVITLSDTGIGIDPDLLPRIFNAFEQGDMATTRNFGGLGLGLAICKQIADLHGATLTAWSQGKGLGATFRMELATSLAAETRGTQGAGRPAEHVGRRSGRILLVEDHSDTRTLMARVLRKQGYEVRTAESVAEAFGLATTENVDLMVCDIGLPDGSGLDLMRQLMTAHRPIKAIALSGFGMEEDINKSRQAGFLEHLTKPVDLNLLEETVDRVMQTQVSGE